MGVDFTEDVVLIVARVIMPAAVVSGADEGAPFDASNVVGLLQLGVPVEVVGWSPISPDPGILGLPLTETYPDLARRQTVDDLAGLFVHGADPRPVVQAGAGAVRRVPGVGVLGDFEVALTVVGPAGGTLVAELFGGGHGLGERRQSCRQVGHRRPQGVPGAGQTGGTGQLLIAAAGGSDRGGRVHGQQQDGTGYHRQHRGQSGRLAAEAWRSESRPDRDGTGRPAGYIYGEGIAEPNFAPTRAGRPG